MNSSNLREQDRRCVAAAERALRRQWLLATPIKRVTLPYSPTLMELAKLSTGVRVRRTISGNKMRIVWRGQPYFDAVGGILNMYVATQLGSDHIV